LVAWVEGIHLKINLLDPSLTMEFTKKDAFTFAKLCNGKRAQVLETHHLLEKKSQATPYGIKCAF